MQSSIMATDGRGLILCGQRTGSLLRRCAAAASPPRRWSCGAGGVARAGTPSPPRAAPGPDAGGAAPVSPFGGGAGAPVPTAAGAAAAPVERPWSTHTWRWRGHKINYATAGCGAPVVLVHGFGASLGHYRRTLPALAAAGYKAYAIDLLGFGASDKPDLKAEGGYTIELWADLVADFVREFAAGGGAAAEGECGPREGGGAAGGAVDSGAVLVGNSIGSLVALAAAAALPRPAVAGLCLLNSAGAMNNKGIVSDWRIVLALPLFWLIDLLLSIPPVARSLFDGVRELRTLKKVLEGVYGNKASVDDDLVSLIAAPADDAGALDVFVSVITGPPGPKPWDLLPSIDAPILVAWGDQDPFTPLDGPVGRFFRELPASRPGGGTEFALLPGVGHCPQDDRPELLHAVMMPWLSSRAFGGGSGGSGTGAKAAAGLQQAQA